VQRPLQPGPGSKSRNAKIEDRKQIRPLILTTLRKSNCFFFPGYFAVFYQIRYAEADLMGAGALVNEGAGVKIIYASDLELPRRRFTIAHELGHLFIENVSPHRASASKELERLCDMFATEILLPHCEFLPMVSGEFHVSALPNVARAFQVSLTT
jgi:Zn-dependent peptidase ImmA (M78 family)